jgi:DNA-binding CsgD family transcriptional regulator
MLTKPDRPPGAGWPAAGPALVGRDRDLARVVGVVARPPGLVVVEGEAGIGKSRIVAELAAHPDIGGRRMLVGACRRIREPFPLGPVLDALRDTGPVLARQRLSPVAGALRPLLPELAEQLPPPCEPLADSAAERHRVFRGLADVLAALGSPVLVVEDGHWADEQTLDFLGYLAAHQPAGLSVVVTFRAEEAGVDLRAATARPASSVTYDHLTLRPLDVHQTGLLAAAILQTDQYPSEEFATYLHERTSGVPFVLQELVALLLERGTLVLRPAGRWVRRNLDELEVPTGVRDSVLERFSRLSADAQAVAEAAAVLHEPMPVPVLAATCRLPEIRALDALAEALQAGLLQEHGASVGYRHVLAVQAVYESIPLPRRQDLHGRAARAAQQLTPPPLGQIAHHLREAGDYGAWACAAERAAAQAVELGDDTEAARLLEDVLRTAPLDATRRGEMTVKLGWSAVQARGLPGVLDLFERALAAGQPQRVRGELRFVEGLLHDYAGDDPRLMRRAAAAAVEDLGDKPELLARALVALGFPWGKDVGAAEHAMWLDRALDLVPAIEDSAAAVYVLGKVASLLSGAGDPRWARLAEQVLDRTRGAPRHPKEVTAYNSIADTACYVGHYELAERLLAAVVGAPGGHRDKLATRTTNAVLDYMLGRWQGLDESVDTLLGELHRWPKHQLDAETIGACLAVARGDINAARPRLAHVVRQALAVNALDLLPVPVGIYLRLAAHQGDADAELAQTAEVFQFWEVKQLWPLAVRALPGLVQALLLVGRVAEAAERAARFEDALSGRDAPFAPAALWHARGFLAENGGEPGAAAAAFAQAADAYDQIPSPYEAAQAREQAAAALFNAGDAAAARMLNAAMDVYEELGARLDADRASRLARQNGLPAPGTHRPGRPSYGDELSPREREVAELAAGGLTNKEIAEKLFVSVKTVESHLHVALRKLGLRTRTDLGSFFRVDGR